VLMAAQLSAELDALEAGGPSQVDARLARAIEIERAAATLDDTFLLMRARLAQAALLERRGQSAPAARLIWDVQAWADQHDSRPLLVRAHQVLSRVFRNLGDLAAYLEHCVAAVEAWDESCLTVSSRASLLMKLADALADNGFFEPAAERYHQAEQAAIADGDVRRRLVILNNRAYTAYQQGDLDTAGRAIERLRSVAADHNEPLDTDSLDTTARVLIGRGDCEQAEVTIRGAIHDYHAGDCQDPAALAEYLLTLAICQRHLGRPDAAQASLDEAFTLCADSSLGEARVRILQEQSELHAACGRFADAFECHKAFYAAEKDLVSQQREARAFERQALFEITEARQEAARFREQAHQDALTGLHNRRFLDERLPALIREATPAAPVVVGLLDLDHFKRVNDTLSHAAGDLVLVGLASLLTRFASRVGSAHGFAARLGGEEFLLVLLGCPVDEATRALDELRRTIADHDWAPVTGALPVTASIGVAAGPPGTSQGNLLSRADQALYAAKRGGRNRVAVDPESAARARSPLRSAVG
jgi:two-component system, cell cycle response regulator